MPVYMISEYLISYLLFSSVLNAYLIFQNGRLLYEQSLCLAYTEHLHRGCHFEDAKAKFWHATDYGVFFAIIWLNCSSGGGAKIWQLIIIFNNFLITL